MIDCKVEYVTGEPEWCKAHARRWSMCLRLALDAIVIRCQEGDPRTDWLPVIRDIALPAISQWRQAQESMRPRSPC